MQYILLNDDIISIDDLKLRLNNRGFFFGDGFFETVKVIEGEVFNFNNHYDRIIDTASFLGIDFFMSKEHLRNLLEKLTLCNNIKKGAQIKMVIYRKSFGKYLPEDNSSDILVTINSSSDNYFQLNQYGLKIDWYPDTPKSKTRLSNFKTLNSLPSILCAQYARRSMLDDAILFNTDNNPIETSNSNIFLVIKDLIYTPSLEVGCIAGTMRNLICNILNVKEQVLTQDMILDADECFVTNSSGVRWVKKISNKIFKKYNISVSLIEKLNHLV